MWKDIFQEIAQRGAREGNLPEATPELLDEIWPALVGESLAQLSSPVQLSDRRLRVAVRHRQLVDDWKSSPMLLLRKIRRFCPWPIETLEIVYDATAGLGDDAPPDAGGDEPPVPSGARPPIETTTDDSLDPELRSIIDAIDIHRRADED